MKTFLDEILEQPEVLRRCLDWYNSEESGLRRSLRAVARPSVVFTGMGASFYAALPAVYYLNAHGIDARAVEAAELAYYRLPVLSRHNWLVVISQSGETVDIERLLARRRTRRPPLVAITNHPRSLLGERADYLLPLHAGAQDFASTKTYSASLFVALLVAALWSEGTMTSLLDGLARHLKAYEELLEAAQRAAPRLADFVGKARQAVLLGRGPSLASALEGALLFKEVSARAAEGMTAAQFRHGPLELLARSLAVVLFAPNDLTVVLNRRLRAELVRHRARVLWVSARPASGRGVEDFSLPRLSPAALTPLFEIVPVQLLTRELARRVGRQPGRLRIASPVTLRE